MTVRTTEERLRRFLLTVSAALFAGTPIELWFAEHTESWMQLVPFGLCALGLGAVALVLLRPSRRAIVGLRGTMLAIAVGGLLGLYQHLEHNIAFEREIRPAAAASQVVWEALSGASPLLAPGIFVITAMLAIAGTYGHPAMGPAQQATERRT
ncbi:MAG TPA: hypothetical protein VF190_11125 [Rhodothermales bacterium]